MAVACMHACMHACYECMHTPHACMYAFQTCIHVTNAFIHIMHTCSIILGRGQVGIKGFGVFLYQKAPCRALRRRLGGGQRPRERERERPRERPREQSPDTKRKEADHALDDNPMPYTNIPSILGISSLHLSD